MIATAQQLKTWLSQPAPPDTLTEQIRSSGATPLIGAMLRQAAPDLSTIQPTTYTLYREFERNGSRPAFQRVYFARRSQLSRAVFKTLNGEQNHIDTIHDLLWAICEETTWVMPAHEEQGPDYWDIDPPIVRTQPLGSHTMLTREPDSIDLFAAETGASLAETVALLGDQLAPEVRQRVRQEVRRHIFLPYLAYGRNHWWYKGALNWNGVCNGAIGLAFLRLETDLDTLSEALAQVLEGLAAYIETGFEADGGSLEGVGYWNYGLMYYVAFAELLRERTHGALDMLGQPKLRAIAAYPPGLSLSPNKYFNPGDASEAVIIAPGIVHRLAERTNTPELAALVTTVEWLNSVGMASAKLAIVMRHAAWWDGRFGTFPEPQAFYLPESGVAKLVGRTTDGRRVVLAAAAGHNDGHHSHADVANFVLHIGETSIFCDAGPGLYNKGYFRQDRYNNVFANAFGHSVPRIGGKLQSPGPEFGGSKQFHGTITDFQAQGEHTRVQIEFARAYDLPTLTSALRTLALDTSNGTVQITDTFAFNGPPLPIEEAFVTWGSVTADGSRAVLVDGDTSVIMEILEPAGAVFRVEELVEASQANAKSRILTRLSAALPATSQQFRARIFVLPIG